MSNRPIYLIPTYHPAAEKLLRILNTEFQIVYYNKTANDRMPPNKHEYEFVDLQLAKIRLKGIDFAVTNTFPVIKFILNERPKYLVTEDYLFCLPYLLLCKVLRIKIIYFNGSTSPQSTRVNCRVVKFLKGAILRCFDDYWHGFKGAEKYVAEYVTVQSKLRPWFLMTKPAVKEVSDDDKLECIYVGEFRKRKRINYILDLWRISVTRNDLNVKVTMVGCDKNSAHYKDEFRALPHDETLELMSQRHILFLLSEREAMGAVVLEALASGLFVVLSKEVGATSYILEMESLPTNHQGIIHYNVNGCIVDPESISPLELLMWLDSHKDLILSNRQERSAELNEHYL